MKKLFITTLVLLTILSLSLAIASCTPGEITKTVTGTQGPTVIIVPTEPPEIPHALLVEMQGSPFFVGDEPLCWYCHGLPQSPDHTGFWLDEEFCTQCHKPMDPPILTPYAR